MRENPTGGRARRSLLGVKHFPAHPVPAEAPEKVCKRKNRHSPCVLNAAQSQKNPHLNLEETSLTDEENEPGRGAWGK